MLEAGHNPEFLPGIYEGGRELAGAAVFPIYLFPFLPFLNLTKREARGENELGKEIVGSSGILEMEETGLRGKGEKQSRVPVD